MHFYQHASWLVSQNGNNAIAYAARMALWSQGKLFLPRLMYGDLSQLHLGHQTVFEEVEHGKLVSCRWLLSLLRIQYDNQTIYITDNHNHALYFWYHALHHGLISKGATLLHVDQHADMNEPEVLIDPAKEHDLDYIAEYVNMHTQIASFIQPALQVGLLSECVQIRSEAKLEEVVSSISTMSNYIVDIDIDFFAHEQQIDSKMALLRQLISQAKLITIATSPSFIDQNRAINLVRELLTGIDN